LPVPLRSGGHEHPDVDGEGRRREESHEAEADENVRHAALVTLEMSKAHAHGVPL